MIDRLSGLSDNTDMPRKLAIEESAWAKKHNAATMGGDTPLVLRILPPKEKRELIQRLIKTGAGDCSIAIRVNKMGYECSRSDVYLVRHGRRPTEHAGLDEYLVD